jgi:hypothetical protein
VPAHRVAAPLRVDGRLDEAVYTSTPPRCFETQPSRRDNSAGTSFGTNVRLRWEYRPGSEVFVVYTDDYDTDTPRGVEMLRNRAFVVKVNRFFRP